MRNKLYWQIFVNLLFHPIEWSSEEHFLYGQFEVQHDNLLKLSYDIAPKVREAHEGPNNVNQVVRKTLGWYGYIVIEDSDFNVVTLPKVLKPIFWLLMRRIVNRIEREINDDQARWVLRSLKW